MKCSWLISVLLFAAGAQAAPPQWANDTARGMEYPREQFFTGFAFRAGANTQQLSDELKAAARSEMIEGIVVQISSEKTLVKSESAGVLQEDYSSVNSTLASAEINGLVVEYVWDNGTGYALAYANKAQLSGYYSAIVAMGMQRAQSAARQASTAEQEGNKARARREWEAVQPILDELAVPQTLLVAVSGGDTPAAMTTETIAALEQARAAISRLQGAILVHVAAREENLGTPVSLLAPRLKALLADHGCSFCDTPSDADWLLTITAATRKGSGTNGICFSYLDADIALVDSRTGREIWRNVFTDIKGGALDFAAAGRKAYAANLDTIAAQLAQALAK